tara:strand:- start:561 stop:1316 length:756 start_codon:yes stop_codon:yes gene_type:complete
VKILVPIKRVVDYNVVVRPTADKKNVDTENVKMGINPFDEIALEEAIRIKESGKADEIVVVTCGEEKCQDILKTALAMGADRALHVISRDFLIPISVAKVLQKIFEKEKPNLIIMGKQAIDDDCNQTGQMLAALTKIPQATFASKVEFTSIDNEIEVSREVDGGIEKIKLILPALVTADLRLNEPRYITLPNIMKAKKKKIEQISINDLNVTVLNKLEIIEIKEPEARKKGLQIKNVDELLIHLKDKSEAI